MRACVFLPPCYNRISITRRGVSSMTAHEAIHELLNIRNYCSAASIPAIDYAIKAIQEKIEQEKEQDR